MDGQQIVKRADERKDLKNGYVEYRAEGTGLAKLFKSGAAKRGLIVNVSRNGLAFRATGRLPIGAKTPVTLVLPGVKTHLQLKGEVRWCREERKMGAVAYTHVIGLRFTEFSPEAWEALNKLLREKE